MLESVDAAQSALRTAGGMLQTRLEIFSLEASIEKKRVLLLATLGTLTGGLVLLTLMTACILSLLAAPPEFRAYIAACWVVASGSLSLLCGLAVWLLSTGGRAPFERTRTEIGKDVACFGKTVKTDA